MSRHHRAPQRPARPARTLLAGFVLAAVALGASLMSPYAAQRASAADARPAVAGFAAAPAAAPAATTPVPTPSCKEWQTVTQVPLRPQAPPTSGVTTTPTGPTRAVCRNAPPTPFPAPAWDPQSVVGGPRLAEQGLIVDLPASVPPPPAVGDVSYLVADLDSGEILAAKAPHAWLRPASTLKTLTALTLLPRVNPNYPVVATEEQVSAEGTRVGMIAGNPYPAHYLFDAMLMISANDAAYALADAAGGYDRTLALMNAKAAEIGAFDTVAKDPSGLDEDGQHTSAYDLALIARAAMQRGDFRAYVAKRDAIFPGGTDATGRFHNPFHINNINDLLGRYPGAIGVKPGRTNRAQHTFVGAATRGGRTLLVTQMGSVKGSWKDTAALLDWGFAHATAVKPVGRLVAPGEATPPSVATATPTSGDAPATTVAETGTPVPAAAAARWSTLGKDLEHTWPWWVAGGASFVAGLVLLLFLAVRAVRRRRG